MYEGSFTVGDVGSWTYRVRAWVDRFATWQAVFRRRVETGSAEAELKSELLEGADILKKAHKKAKGDDKKVLRTYIGRFEAGDAEAALEDDVTRLARVYDPRDGAAESAPLTILVERPLAQFSSWYSFFPRSLGKNGAHGTLDDAAAHLDYIKEMGFDIAYLTPIHPIGTSFRKGKDNAPTAQQGEPGSPYAIGSEDGGLTEVHPELGGMPAFERFMARAKELRLEVALDVALKRLARPPLGQVNTLNWFQAAPRRVRFVTPKTRPKSIRTSTRSTSRVKTGKTSGTALRDVFGFWAE